MIVLGREESAGAPVLNVNSFSWLVGFLSKGAPSSPLVVGLLANPFCCPVPPLLFVALPLTFPLFCAYGDDAGADPSADVLFGRFPALSIDERLLLPFALVCAVPISSTIDVGMSTEWYN
jgi:hypothetical protein